MTSRKTKVTMAQVKKMSMNELAALLTIEELKHYIIKMNADLNEDYDLVINAMLQALDPLMPEDEYIAFCDAL